MRIFVLIGMRNSPVLRRSLFAYKTAMVEPFAHFSTRSSPQLILRPNTNLRRKWTNSSAHTSPHRRAQLRRAPVDSLRKTTTNRLFRAISTSHPLLHLSAIFHLRIHTRSFHLQTATPYTVAPTLHSNSTGPLRMDRMDGEAVTTSIAGHSQSTPSISFQLTVSDLERSIRVKPQHSVVQLMAAL